MDKEIFNKLEKEYEEGSKLLLNDDTYDLKYNECNSLLDNAKGTFELMSKAFIIGYLRGIKCSR